MYRTRALKMSRSLIDADSILSNIDQWNKLDTEWGTPVDLETEDHDYFIPEVESRFSTLEHKRPTFDSAVLLRNIRRTIRRSASKNIPNSKLNYEGFIQDLELSTDHKMAEKQFYFVGGEIISAMSVKDICKSIENIFKSIEQLCTATSTVRKKTRNTSKITNIVECSISATGLSFDDTSESNEILQNVDQFIDELFNVLDCTLTSMQNCSIQEESIDQLNDQSVHESVTSLVKKFSSFIDSPAIKCNKRRRQCSERFKNLIQFWKSQSGC